MTLLNKCRAVHSIESPDNNVGGLVETFWLFFKSGLRTQISTKQKSDISSIDFIPYNGFIRFDCIKFQNQYSSTLVVNEKGNRSYTQNLIVKLFTSSTLDDVTIQQLNKSQDIIALIQDTNHRFYLLGSGSGMFVTSDVQQSGVINTDVCGDTLSFIGYEIIRPLRFNLGDFDSTLAYILAHETDSISDRIFDETFDETFN